jgi:hypothetical protein
MSINRHEILYRDATGWFWIAVLVVAVLISIAFAFGLAFVGGS